MSGVRGDENVRSEGRKVFVNVKERDMEVFADVKE